MYRKDRSCRGGGVLMAVRDSISATISPSPNDLEVVSIVVSIPQPVTICTVYTPPNASDGYHKSMHSYLANLARTSNQLP